MQILGLNPFKKIKVHTHTDAGQLIKGAKTAAKFTQHIARKRRLGMREEGSMSNFNMELKYKAVNRFPCPHLSKEYSRQVSCGFSQKFQSQRKNSKSLSEPL